MEEPRSNPEWEHWPGRSADDGVRNRLRELFAPEAGDAVAELIAAHAHELEERSDELRRSVAELEQRETRARELHGRVEQVLREGSAELDLRHAELTVRAAELDRRETAVEEAEARVQERRRELGAVELRGAAVERREQALAERETEIERRADNLERRATDLDQRALDLDTLSRRLADALTTEPETEREPEPEAEPELQREPEPTEAQGLAPTASPPTLAPVEALRAVEPAAALEGSHVALIAGEVYRLVERGGAAPEPGEIVELDDGAHRCVRLAPSPLPGDVRRCAILERVELPARRAG